MEKKIKEIEKILKYNFKRITLLETALTHKSFDNNDNNIKSASKPCITILSSIKSLSCIYDNILCSPSPFIFELFKYILLSKHFFSKNNNNLF